MLIIKPNLCSSLIKQTLTVCSSNLFIKNFHFSCTTTDSSQEPQVKRVRKKRKPKTDKNVKKKETKKFILNSSYDLLIEQHSSLKDKKSSPSYVFSEDVAGKLLLFAFIFFLYCPYVIHVLKSSLPWHFPLFSKPFIDLLRKKKKHDRSSPQSQLFLLLHLLALRIMGV